MSTAAALVGTYGMQAVLDDTTPIYIRDPSAGSGQARLPPSHVTAPASASRRPQRGHAAVRRRPRPFDFAQGRLDGCTNSATVFRVQLLFVNGAYHLRVKVRNDAGVDTNTTAFPITDAPHLIEVHWAAASAPGANDGALSLWLDGALRQSLSGIDNPPTPLCSAQGRLVAHRASAAGAVGQPERGHHGHGVLRRLRVGAADRHRRCPVRRRLRVGEQPGLDGGGDRQWRLERHDDGGAGGHVRPAGGDRRHDADLRRGRHAHGRGALPRCFYFDPNSVTLPSNEDHDILAGRTSSSAAFRVQVAFVGGAYQVRAKIRDDAGADTSSADYTLSDAAHFVEVDWAAASAPGANDGYLSLWLDGALKETVSGIDNPSAPLRAGSLSVEKARLGAPSSLEVGIAGTEYIDAFESRRQTYIGPVGGGSVPGGRLAALPYAPDQPPGLLTRLFGWLRRVGAEVRLHRPVAARPATTALAAPPAGQVWKSYAYAGAQLIAMRVEGDPNPAQNGVYYLHSDHLGSMSLTTDANGNVVARQSYYPFGQIRPGGTGLPPAPRPRRPPRIHPHRPIMLTAQVSRSTDDAEEQVSNGSVDLTRSNLELGSEGGTSQIVGMRFTNLTVPPRRRSPARTSNLKSTRYTIDKVNILEMEYSRNEHSPVCRNR